MKRNNFYLIAIAVSLTAAVACNNAPKEQDHSDHKDTVVVVEKNTTQDYRTPGSNAATEPATNVSVDKNGATVNSNGTDVTVSKDSVTFKKR